MRVKKQKQHRRAVRFYRACFGFREPFKILCDGTFVHHLLTNGITPADTALVGILGASVKIFTTRCLIAELKNLGKSYSDSLNTARCLMTARCDHEKLKSAEACVMDVIGENNRERFFVATQDSDLRKKCQEIPGVPVIYALRNALFLERPSASQQEFAKAAEEGRSYMTQLEYETLNVEEKKVPIEEARDSADANNPKEDRQLETQYQKKKDKRTTVMEDKAQFKRKRAKGPNPLSCKKKKKRENAIAAPEKENKSSEKSVGKKRRKRKRNRKNKKATEWISSGI